MGRMIYAMGVSLDGYVEDAGGGFEWSAPDDELHRLANRHARETAAFLFGRRLYELMEGHWPAAAGRRDQPAVEAEFAQAYVETPRIVFSDTLEAGPGGARPVRRADAVREAERLKAELDGDLSVGGAGLAASLVELIDEFRLYVAPVLVGGGKRFFPPLPERLALRRLEAREFDSGALYLAYERAA